MTPPSNRMYKCILTYICNIFCFAIFSLDYKKKVGTSFSLFFFPHGSFHMSILMSQVTQKKIMSPLLHVSFFLGGIALLFSILDMNLWTHFLIFCRGHKKKTKKRKILIYHYGNHATGTET